MVYQGGAAGTKRWAATSGAARVYKIGDVFGATVARMIVTEILADRGELAEAEANSAGVAPVVAGVGVSLLRWGITFRRLGVSRCAVAPDDTLGRFEEAQANFVHVEHKQDTLATDARIAECNVFLGNADAALELADEHSPRAASTNAVARGGAAAGTRARRGVAPAGDVDGARHAFAASLAAGRTRHDRFEVALALLALIRLDQLEGAEPSPDVVGESRSLLASLKVRSVPNVPSLSQPVAMVKTGISRRGAKDAEKYVTVLFPASGRLLWNVFRSESSEIANYRAIAKVEDRRRSKGPRPRFR